MSCCRSNWWSAPAVRPAAPSGEIRVAGHRATRYVHVNIAVNKGKTDPRVRRGNAWMRVAASQSYIATPSPLWLAAALAPGLAIVVCLVLYPIGLAIWASVGTAGGGITLQRYAAFFAEGESYRALTRTVGL